MTEKNQAKIDAQRTNAMEFTHGSITATIVLRKDGDVQLGAAEGLADLIGSTFFGLIADRVVELAQAIVPSSPLHNIRKHRSSHSISIGGYEVTLKLKVVTKEGYVLPAATFADFAGAFFYTTTYHTLTEIDKAKKVQYGLGFFHELMGGFTFALFDRVHSDLFGDKSEDETDETKVAAG